MWPDLESTGFGERSRKDQTRATALWSPLAGLTPVPVPRECSASPRFVFQTIEFDESAGAVLRIQPLRTPRDENIYECVAQNLHGEVTVQARLTVLRGKSKPRG